MRTKHVQVGNFQAVEIISEEIIIRTEQDVLDLMGEYQADGYILYTHNFEDDFFDLSTRKLGDILQKLTNYRVKLAIIGDFSKYKSKVLKDFIYESNKVGEYLFVSSMDEVKKRWSEK